MIFQRQLTRFFVFVKGMSVYDQIASKTRHRRQRKTIDDNKLDEQTEEEEDDDDDDDRTSINHQVRFSEKKVIFIILFLIFSFQM